jgi:hypothetical protein
MQTGEIECKKVPLESAGEPEPSNVAVKVAELANLNGCQIIMIDGSQAWRHPHNGHAYQRNRESKLNTPAKTGLLLLCWLLLIPNKYTIQHISLSQVRN